ncbi:MAG: acyl-CoA dehydrogenase family protein [Candidatus Hodarchaeota archaeon]
MFDVLLNKSEQEIKYRIRQFVREKVPSSLLKAMDADEVKYPREFVEEVAKLNLLGLRFPQKYGGRGMSWVAEMAAIEEIGVLGASLGCLYSLPSIVGEALDYFGTEDQKKRYLRPTLEGKLFCAEALTEPRGGSDFFGATTKARRVNDHYVLSGQKRFIVGAEGADYFLVYAKSHPNAPPHQSISVFLVDRQDSLEVRKVYGLMGTRGGGTGRLIFHDVKVPIENRIGQEQEGGIIFNRMMLPERMTSAAGALGAARAALEVATRYSTKRKAFGQHIKEFQAVSFRIADSVSLLDSARALVYTAAKTIDENLEARRLVSEAKKIATETAWTVVNNAMQILGGIGYTSVYPVEKLLRDIRLMMIWTGTNEIMNLIIQHQYFKELETIKQPSRDIEQDATDLDEEEKVYE